MSIDNHDVSSAKTLWSFLRSKGLTEQGIAGLVGNLDAESCLRTNNLQNSCNTKWNITDEEYTRQVDAGLRTFIDKGGYGWAQWTSNGRKQSLKNVADTLKASVSDPTVQLTQLWNELSTSYKKKVLTVLTDPSKTVYECAVQVMVYYEAPANQSDANKQKRANNAQAFYDKYADKGETPAEEDKGDYLMTSSELIAKAKYIYDNYKTTYVLGGFGAPATDKNKNRYTNNYKKYLNSGKIGTTEYNKTVDNIAKAASNVFFFDCVGLIKGILWGWNGTLNSNYGGAKYASNGVPDVGADSMMNKYCKGVSSNFDNIVPGEAVWVSGHIGIYLGDGEVIESTVKWSHCTQISKLGNWGLVGERVRTWSKHGRLPWVKYTTSTSENPIKTTPVSESSKKVESAKYKDSSIAGVLRATTSLNLRTGAGTSKEILTVMPKGTEVRCYGYYNIFGLTKWYLVVATVGNVVYTGYCSSKYLIRV